LCGKVWGYNIENTLSSIGVMIACLSGFLFWPGSLQTDTAAKVRIIILALLPFVGYFVPLFHFFWVANVWAAEYYRLCYSSMFWLFFGYLLQLIEKKYHLYIERVWDKKQVVL